MTPKEILKKYYGYPDFRPGQRELIGNIMAGRDVVGILPTGGGKSVCYQIPAIAMKGLALVISPLISLMKDQVDSLEKNGVRARFLNSSSSSEEYFDTVNLARRGQLDLLYVAPERLESDSFINTLSGFEISMVAVDEAHCVS
ncbi:MAG: DEAD/DEAH box helicase, partial [Clostridia bacterium]|nr:DEAD/DEAH box helicase [Clostridia bacterium]